MNTDFQFFHILQTDCVLGMASIPEHTVDVVVTSPPYNIGKKYNTYLDTMPESEYARWVAEWRWQIKRVLKPDGSFFLNVGSTSKNPFFAFQMAETMRREFHLQNTFHWVKAISIDKPGGTESYGHFKPIISSRYVNNCHEYVFHFTPEGNTALDRLAIGVPYADKTNVARWAHTGGQDNRCRGDVWFIPYKTIQCSLKQRPHPATFPVELAVKCIRLHGQKKMTVLDPFVGIGHSAVAAKQCNDIVERFFGFDIDEEYIQAANRAIV